MRADPGSGIECMICACLGSGVLFSCTRSAGNIFAHCGKKKRRTGSRKIKYDPYLSNIMKTLITFLLLWLFCSEAVSQNWYTVGGNNQRNGRVDFNGSVLFEVKYRKPSLPTIWGNQIFVEGNKLVTTRYVSLNPIRALLACHNATTGDSLWTRNYAENGVMVIMGFRDNQIYARNFQQQGFDTIYAINPDDGSVIWKSRHTVERGIIWSAVFADNGDLIIPGSASRSVMRINRLNGDTVWTRYRIIPNTGAECMCVFGNTVYTFEGGITTPKRLMAIDIANGAIKYYSQTLPGDGDQEIPFSIGRDGTIYVVRDGGSLHALKDNGTGFSQLWVRPLPGAVGTYSTFGVMADDDLVIGAGKRIYKIDNISGSIVDSTAELISGGTLNARIAVDGFNTVYVGNGASIPSEGKYFAFNGELNTLWTDPMPYNYYSGPALAVANSINGLYYCGSGTEITCIARLSSVNSEEEQLPAAISLFENYPNPFNPSTSIKFELLRPQNVGLKIYDMLGNFVDEIFSGKLRKGTHEFRWDAGNLSSGFYVCRVTTEAGTASRKMMLVR